MRITIAIAATVAVALLAELALASELEFRTEEIGTGLGVGYAVVVEDMNDDERPDIVVVDTNRVIWYENPTWRVHTLIADATARDNVCIAPYDIDGDGRLDFALGAGWKGLNTTAPGTIQWLRRGTSSQQPASVHAIDEEASVHRMRWADLDGDGRAELVVVPLLGRETRGPEFAERPVRILAYTIPDDPAADPWPRTVLNEELHVAHNFFPTDVTGDGKLDLLVVSFEGVSLLERNNDGSWTRKLIGSGNQETSPSRGASEIKLGRLADGSPYLATIEPWHGFQVVVYTPPAEGEELWTRHLIDDELKWGHAVWCANLDDDADEELVIGVRDNRDEQARCGVRVYDPVDASAGRWECQLVDPGGVAVEDAAVADLNDDGRLDIVAVGRATHNVRIYWNEASAKDVSRAKSSDDIPMSGKAQPGMESYDRLVTELMQKWNVPGGAVAVAKHGLLVFARGYGWADVENDEPVEPDSLFRLASISKPITAAAILRLVEQGRLDLDARVFDILTAFPIPDGDGFDQRQKEITVRQCLSHTGGWDRDASFDPMFRPTAAAEAVGATPPADATTVIRYMIGQPLDFEPGHQYAYSNYGYCLLGRVIEKLTGEDYATAAKKLVFEPAGMRRMRLGCSLRDGRAAGEVCYYHHTPSERADCVFPGNGEKVPWPYGGFYLEAMDSHGGWIGSAVDLLRFVTAVEGSRGEPLLTDESLELMTARPPAPVAVDKPTYYGLGWNIRPKHEDANWWHGGSLPGTMTLLVRTASPADSDRETDGLAWAALFNLRPDEREQFRDVLDDQLWKAAHQVTEWPEHDLFGEFE